MYHKKILSTLSVPRENCFRKVIKSIEMFTQPSIKVRCSDDIYVHVMPSLIEDWDIFKCQKECEELCIDLDSKKMTHLLNEILEAMFLGSIEKEINKETQLLAHRYGIESMLKYIARHILSLEFVCTNETIEFIKKVFREDLINNYFDDHDIYQYTSLFEDVDKSYKKQLYSCMARALFIEKGRSLTTFYKEHFVKDVITFNSWDYLSIKILKAFVEEKMYLEVIKNDYSSSDELPRNIPTEIINADPWILYYFFDFADIHFRNLFSVIDKDGVKCYLFRYSYNLYCIYFGETNPRSVSWCELLDYKADPSKPRCEIQFD